MMQTFQDVTLNPASGVVQVPNLPGEIDWVLLDNDSPYDVLVSTNPRQPNGAALYGSDWQLKIRSNRSVVFFISDVSKLQTPFGETSQPFLWVMAVDPGGLLNLGSVSTRRLLHVTGGSGDVRPPAIDSSQRQIDISNQPRVVSVPPAPQVSAPRLVSGGVPITAPIVGPTAFSTAQIVFYLYSLTLSCSDTSLCHLVFKVTTIGFSPTSTTYREFVIQFPTSSPYHIPLAFPIAKTIPAPGTPGANTWEFDIQIVSMSAGLTNGIYIETQYDYDSINTTPVPTAGGGMAAANITGSYIGGANNPTF